MREKSLILALICLAAYRIRLVMVKQFEPVLHQFDSYDHLRQLKEYTKADSTLDGRVNYPYGRQSQSPSGFVLVASGLHEVMSGIGFTSSIEESCIYFAPVIAMLTTLATYALTNVVIEGENGALIAAGLMAIIPGYLAQSNGATFDVESLAILILIGVVYFFIRAVKSGSLSMATLSALAYGLLAITWSKHAILGNMIGLFMMLIILSNRYTTRSYIAYSTFYSMTALFTLSVDILTLDDLLPLFTFIFMQLYALADLARFKMPSKSYVHFVTTVLGTLAICTVLLLLVAIGNLPGGEVGVFFAEFDTIKQSGSGAQSSSWAAFFVDCHITLVMAPVGINLCLNELNDQKLFVLTYLFVGLYCAAHQISALVWLTPVLCLLTGLVMGHLLVQFKPESDQMSGDMTKRQRDLAKERERTYPHRKLIQLVVLGLIGATLATSLRHGNWAASNSYSDPTLFLTATKKSDGSTFIFDDFRESYAWLNANTDAESKVMLWKDQAYQINELANRTTISNGDGNVDVVADIFTSTEEEAHDKLLRMNVDYVMVTFGGMVTYGSDDIAKFMWMARIAGKDEQQFKNENGEFRIDADGAEKWMETTLYKLCYYRYGQMNIESGRPTGWDRVRRAEVGNKDYALDVFDEVYTSKHWLIRIFRVKQPDNLGNNLVL